jgi:hypothetical protein
MARVLRANVAVDGAWYGPAYRVLEPPVGVAERISNPDAWREDTETQTTTSTDGGLTDTGLL